MLQLKEEAAAEWVEPVRGLKVYMDPVSTPVIVDMRLILSDLMRQLEIGGDFGAVDEAIAEQAADEAPARRTGRITFTMVAAIVSAGALKWEGFGDEKGKLLPNPQPMQVYRLLRQSPAIFDFFDKGYANDVFALLSEKNGSSPSPSGSSAREADPTAGIAADDNTAEAKASPAPSTSTP